MPWRFEDIEISGGFLAGVGLRLAAEMSRDTNPTRSHTCSRPRDSARRARSCWKTRRLAWRPVARPDSRCYRSAIRATCRTSCAPPGS